VEARERAESWGVTIHPPNLKTFDKDREIDPEQTSSMTKKLNRLDDEMRALVETALRESKEPKVDRAAEMDEMRALVDDALGEPTRALKPLSVECDRTAQAADPDHEVLLISIKTNEYITSCYVWNNMVTYHRI
jgi:hypothetical protein